MKLVSALMFLSLTVTLPAAAQCAAPFVREGLPIKSGHLAYQSRNTADESSSLYLFDFAGGTLDEISGNWTGISKARNPDFSPDGRWIAFMAVQSGDPNAPFDVFVWDRDNPGAQPVNLTNGDGVSEDPKFSFDGKLVVYKHSGDIWLMRLTFDEEGNIVGDVKSYLTQGGTRNGDYTEASAPVLALHDTYVIFFRGTAKKGTKYPAKLYMLRIDPKTLAPKGRDRRIAPDGIQYYPILRQTGALFYARHIARDLHDQVWARMPDYKGTAGALHTNICGSDNSDPEPVSTRLLFFSVHPPCDDSDTCRYTLYLGNYLTGEVWPMADSPINTPPYDLEGSSYTVH